MIPRRFAPVVFGFILSGLMSFIVAGIATVRATGLEAGFAGAWMRGWWTAWLFAFPVVLLAAPWARRLVERVVEKA